MFDLGEQYPAAIDVLDAAGNPVNAVTVVLTITHPDGTTETPTVLNPPAVTGQYRLAYLPAAPGRYMVRWVTTAPNTAYTDSFDVKTANTPSILSLADMRLTLGMTDPGYTRDDAELLDKGTAITALIEGYVHEVIVPRPVTEKIRQVSQRHWSLQGARIRLSFVPVISIQSLTTRDGQFSWNVANLDGDFENGLIEAVTGPPIRGSFLLAQYTPGYVIIPPNYAEGARVLLQHLWEARRGPGGLDGVLGPEELADFRHYSTLPRKVTQWLSGSRPVVM